MFNLPPGGILSGSRPGLSMIVLALLEASNTELASSCNLPGQEDLMCLNLLDVIEPEA